MKLCLWRQRSLKACRRSETETVAESSAIAYRRTNAIWSKMPSRYGLEPASIAVAVRSRANHKLVINSSIELKGACERRIQHALPNVHLILSVRRDPSLIERVPVRDVLPPQIEADFGIVPGLNVDLLKAT